jgi:DNA adenine methylase
MQTDLEDFQLTVAEPIVNVASVRHLSPFRYPGGKTWLVPTVLATLRSLPTPPIVFVDPFLGGGSVPLAALIEGCVERVVLYEIDPAVAAVWTVIFSNDYAPLCEKILNFEITRERVIDVVSQNPNSVLDSAFQTIVRNRTFRGGILASGASLIKEGEKGKGVASRWYPDTLVKRIQLLHEFSSQVTFIQGDGLAGLRQFAPDPAAFVFVDPPYTAGGGKRAGSRLYDHSDIDHESVFSTLAEGEAQFMMTYDDDLDVLNLARRNNFILQHVAMKNTHHRCMRELLITRG